MNNNKDNYGSEVEESVIVEKEWDEESIIAENKVNKMLSNSSIDDLLSRGWVLS